VLLLDEPTNDLDTDTLAALEDLLDTWPGTLIVASHDRYLVERVADTVYGMFGDGRLIHLPGGVDEYLARVSAPEAREAPEAAGQREPRVDPRAAKKELARLERQVAKLEERAGRLHEELAMHATDYEKVTALDAELRTVQEEKARTEEAWLILADEA